MKNKTITIGLIQQSRSKNLNLNLEETIREIKESARLGAKIICLQELFRSEYFCQTESLNAFKLSETIPGPTTKILSKISQELEVVIIAPIFEKRTEGIYHNTAVIIDADGSIAGFYRKMHIPDDPYFYEKFYFTPGDSGFKSFDTRYGRLGILICWDQWFPEAARLVAMSGAQIIFYPTAIGYHDKDFQDLNKQVSAWETVQKAHAISNGIFIAAVNRTGREDNINFWGRSFVCDPFGQIITQANGKKSENLIIKCDLLKIEQTRQEWPFLRDRRIDAYKKLTHVYDDPDGQ
jgi:N-carbamoylputrescine amidase